VAVFDSQQAALEFLKRKQVVPTSDYQEIWGRNHAFAFTIAQALRFDIVAATKQTLVTALEQGWSERKTRQVMSEVHKRMGVTTANPWRLQTIYRTNMQAAYQAGRWNAMWAMRDDRPWLQYVAVMDGSTRETHAALNGKIARVTDSIWREIYPPNGFNCRCRVRALTNAQAKGKKRIRKLPTGFPDSGFDYNPALAQAEALGRKINASTARLGPDAGKLAALFIAQFPTEAAPLVPLAWIGE